MRLCDLVVVVVVVTEIAPLFMLKKKKAAYEKWRITSTKRRCGCSTRRGGPR
jgi:hypothetical protein